MCFILITERRKKKKTFAGRCRTSCDSSFKSSYDQVFSSIFYSNICSRASRLDMPLGCPGLFTAYVVYEQLQNQLPFPWNKAVKFRDSVLIRDTEMSKSTVHNCIATTSFGLLFKTCSFWTIFPGNLPCVSVQNEARCIMAIL